MSPWMLAAIVGALAALAVVILFAPLVEAWLIDGTGDSFDYPVDP